MKTKNKLLRVILCLLALTLLLAACNSQEDSTGSSGDTGNPDGTLPPQTVSTTGDTQPTPPQPSNGDDPDAPTVDGCKITFGKNRGADIESETNFYKPVEAGTEVSFTVRVSAFYTGTPAVYAGEQELKADADGTYRFTVESDTVITVEGLSLNDVSIDGSGTSDDPFVITKAVDMLYIAEMVNQGDSTYCYGQYTLSNDLDFQGEELVTIGDGSTDSAIFSGYFQGNGKTISNFRINADSTQYVGVFGVVYADMSGSGGGSIIDLHLKDFTVESAVSGKAAFVGSMVGYGMGANLLLCSAENGTINIYADTNSFSYAGGLMGIQQALDYSGYSYYSSVSYCHSDVDIYCNSGLVYAAGGIAGYVASSGNGVTSYINNCYAYGDVYGSMRAGGLAGYLASGTSLVNSYATGAVSAQTSSTDVVNSEEFCHAYAGGLVGYAEANSIISECFSTSQLSATATMGSAYAVTNGKLAFAAAVEEYDYGYKPATVYNCYYALGGKADGIDLTSGSFISSNLHWIKHDWVFTEGSYPTVNLEDTTESKNYTFTLTIKAGEKETKVEEMDVLMPLHFWYRYTDENGNLAGVPSRVTTEQSTKISYGYYFDEARSIPVPEGFIPSYDMTLYAAVADVSAVAGDYDLMVEGCDEIIRLTLNTDGTFTYPDAGKTAKSGYIYDGSTIIFEDARFARYISGTPSLEHYQNYTFCATVLENGSLKIVGGVYDDGTSLEETVFFTDAAPLMAVPVGNGLSGTYGNNTGIYTFRADGTGTCQTTTGIKDLTYTRTGSVLTVTMGTDTINGSVNDGAIMLNGEALKSLDMLAGSWNIDSVANKVYTFDGIGSWTYCEYSYVNGVKTLLVQDRGSYTIWQGNSVTLNKPDGDSWNAAIGDGYLWVQDRGIFHRDGGFRGTWVYEDYGMTLYLDGITANGQGTARVEYRYDNGIVEFYNLIYALDDKDSSRICLYLDNDIFGYMSYNSRTDRLSATIYVGPMGTFMTNVNLSPVDGLAGMWFPRVFDYEDLSFDSNGLVTIGKGAEAVQVRYTRTPGTLSGSFYYNGEIYRFKYDEAEEKLVVNDNRVYYRQDEFADLTLTDGNGTFYTFNGEARRGSGVMTVSGGIQYIYNVGSEGIDLYDYATSNYVGIIKQNGNAYQLQLDNGDPVELRIHTVFTDVWARSGFDTGMTIGTMGSDGKLPGKIGTQEVEFEMVEDDVLTFQLSGETFYVILVGDDLVISQYREWYLYTSDVYTNYCARMDKLFGTWKNSLGAAYLFDGMSNATLTNGLAQSGQMVGNTFRGSTAFGYTYRGDDVILWTTDSQTGELQVYRLKFCDVNTKRAFINEDGTQAFQIETGDKLYNMEALDENADVSYFFDGFGKVTTSDGHTYDYQYTSVDYEDSIVKARITIDGEVWNATIDFGDEQATITLEK